jgi:hypothetical protein
MYSVSDRYDLELPPGFSGYALPVEQLAKCDWGRYRFRAAVDKRVLCCERTFDLQGGVVPPERYNEVRQFTDACVDGDASDIVLITDGMAGPRQSAMTVADPWEAVK